MRQFVCFFQLTLKRPSLRSYSSGRIVKSSLVLLVSGSAVVSGAAYLALTNDDFKQLWNDNVPQGQKVLDLYAQLYSMDLKEATTKASDSISQTTQSLKDQGRQLMENASNTVNHVVSQAQEFANGVQENAKASLDALDQAKEKAQGFLKETRESTEKVYTDLQKSLSDQQQAFSSVIETAKEKYEDLVHMIKGDNKEQVSVAKDVSVEKGHIIQEIDVAVATIPVEEIKTAPEEILASSQTEPAQDLIEIPVAVVVAAVHKVEPDTLKESVEPATSVSSIISEPEKSIETKEDIAPQEVASTSELVKESVEPVSSVQSEKSIDTKEEVALQELAPAYGLFKETEDNSAPEINSLLKETAPEAEKALNKEAPPVNILLEDQESPVPDILGQVLISPETHTKEIPTFDLDGMLQRLSNNETLKKFTKAVHQAALGLGELLGAVDPNAPAVPKLDKARGDLVSLASLLSDLENEEAALVQKALIEQGEEFSEILREHLEVSYMAMAIQAMDLEDSYNQKLAQLQKESETAFENQLSTQLLEQSARLLSEKERALESQAEALRQQWDQIVKEKVDEERGGRLAKLDQLTYKVKLLEGLTLEARERFLEQNKLHQLSVALNTLKRKLEAPHHSSFEIELKALKFLAQSHPFIQTILIGIPTEAPIRGVVSLDELRGSFEHLAKRVQRIQLMPEDGGPISFGISYLLSFLILSKRGLVAGEDTESILSRTRYYLSLQDLDSATRELNQLRGWQRALVKEWLKSARERLECSQVLDASVFL